MSDGRARRVCTGAALLAYLLLTLWAMRDVLPAPATLLLEVPRSWRDVRNMSDSDQRMVVAVVTRNARRIATRPWELLRDGHCYPTPRAYTLGEHMFGNGLLAALPYAISGDPIVAYNVLICLTLWIAAAAMYALALHFTRSPPAAFVAGVLFAFAPMRLWDPIHPYVHGDLWGPLALLFLHRLFVDGRWRSAAGFALFFALQIGESLYALLSTATFVAVLGTWLAVRHRRRLPALAVKLLAAGCVIAGVAWLVLGPYLASGALWGFHREGSHYAPPGNYLPGGRSFPGWVATALALVALLDRLRGRRPRTGDDPRLAFLAAGLLVLLSSTEGIALPLGGLVVPSPLLLARTFVPGLDAVRVLAAVGIGVYLACALLAGYGVLALVARWRTRGAVALAAAASVAAMVEFLAPDASTRSFGAPRPSEAVRMRPPDDEIALVRQVADGAVLDLPHWSRVLQSSSHYLLLGAYHARPSAACYNSFSTPIESQIERLAGEVPAPDALDALSALGFRTIFVHRELISSPERTKEIGVTFARAVQAGDGRLVAVGSAGKLDAYRLAPQRAVARDFAMLAPAAETAPVPLVPSPPGATGEGLVRFAVRNQAAVTFLHPEPFAPSDLVVRWRSADGERSVTQARALLPLAIAAGAVAPLELTLPIPARAGTYEVEVARAAAPDAVLGRGVVRVDPAAPLPVPAAPPAGA